MNVITYVVALVAIANCDEYGLPPKNIHNINFLPGIRQPEKAGLIQPIVVPESSSKLSQGYEIDIHNELPPVEFPKQALPGKPIVQLSDGITDIIDIRKVSSGDFGLPVIGGLKIHNGVPSAAYNIDIHHVDNGVLTLEHVPIFIQQGVEHQSGNSQAYTIELHHNDDDVHHDVNSGSIGQEHEINSQAFNINIHHDDSEVSHQSQAFSIDEHHDATGVNSGAFEINLHHDDNSGLSLEHVPVSHSSQVFSSEENHKDTEANSQAYTIELHHDGSDVLHGVDSGSVGQEHGSNSQAYDINIHHDETSGLALEHASVSHQSQAFSIDEHHDSGAANSQVFHINIHEDGSKGQGGFVSDIDSEILGVGDKHVANSQAYTIDIHNGGSADLGEVQIEDLGVIQVPVISNDEFQSHDISKNSQEYSIDIHKDVATGNGGDLVSGNFFDQHKEVDSGIVSEVPAFVEGIVNEGPLPSHAYTIDIQENGSPIVSVPIVSYVKPHSYSVPALVYGTPYSR